MCRRDTNAVIRLGTGQSLLEAVVALRGFLPQIVLDRAETFDDAGLRSRTVIRLSKSATDSDAEDAANDDQSELGTGREVGAYPSTVGPEHDTDELA